VARAAPRTCSCSAPTGPTRSSHLCAAANQRELDTAGDKAAVLDWRLDDTGLRNAGPGPCRGLPGIPKPWPPHEQWGSTWPPVRHGSPISRARCAPRPKPSLGGPPGGPAGVVADCPRGCFGDGGCVAVRDAGRPGRPPPHRCTTDEQGRDYLAARARPGALPARPPRPCGSGCELIGRAAPDVRNDDFAPLLAERLAAMSRAGIDARGLLHTAVTAGTLPDDHAAAALWWRISRHLSPAVAEQIDAGGSLATSWTPRLAEFVGAERPTWSNPARGGRRWSTTVDHGIARGWRLEDLLGSGAGSPVGDVDDVCLPMVWRMSVLVDPVPDEERYEPSLDEPPEDMWDGVVPPEDAAGFAEWDLAHRSRPHTPPR